MIILPENVDFKKYRRFFTFGCSFTEYIWPTWSNILKEEMSTAEYYNFGASGAGNMMISNRIVEADLKFKFNKDDLIIVMWSTFCREDRWLTGRGWMHPGNIFSQNEYDSSFVEKFSDETGYLIKDMALITLANNYLENNKCHSISLMSVPIDHQQHINNPVFKEVKRLYDPIINKMPESLYTLEMNRSWENGHSYYLFDTPGHDSNKLFDDYHPNPSRYCQYLLKIGFELSDHTVNYAHEVTDILKSSTVNPKNRDDMNHERLYSSAKMF
jgi:hypothetical protein